MSRPARPPTAPAPPPASGTPTEATARLRCISWNVHRGRGKDGRVDPARTGEVLRREVCTDAPDILCLQEADTETPPHRGLLDIAQAEAATGLTCLHDGPDARWGAESHGFLGVILFLAPHLRLDDLVLLDLPGHCHRGAVVADVSCAGEPVRIVGTHLSLGQPARIAQMRTIGQHLFRRAPRQTILMGDLNEWRPWGGLALSRAVVGLDLRGPARATFPATRALLPLDRILTTAPGAVSEARALDGPGIRAASDHRPLTATVRLGPP